MPDPTPIRGRWTVWVGADGQRVADDDAQWADVVEVVPVPDEQAIERAVDAARLTFNDETLSLATLWPAIARAVLTAALEQPE